MRTSRLSSVSPDFLARRDRLGEALAHIVLDQFGERILVAAPERLQRHPIRRLRTGEELADVEPRLARDDRAQPGFRLRLDVAVRNFPNLVHSVYRSRHGDGRGAVLGGARERLLLMPGPLAEHAVQPEREEPRDHRQNNDVESHRASDPAMRYRRLLDSIQTRNR